MKVTLKRIEPGPVMIGPDDANAGDVVEYCEGVLALVTPDPDGYGMYLIREGMAGHNWAKENRQKLLSRIGGMPKSEGHRLGDLPVGTIVPGRVIESSGFWKVQQQHRAGTGLWRIEDGAGQNIDPDTRVSVAYEAVEFQEPEE